MKHQRALIQQFVRSWDRLLSYQRVYSYNFNDLYNLKLFDHLHPTHCKLQTRRLRLDRHVEQRLLNPLSHNFVIMAEEEETRAVKLKINYTFDAEHKANHLSRGLHSYIVPTADFNGPIGVIDLKSCLNLITGSSPELTNFAEVDYTVYSYDVSEEDSPLVGHGLLSKIMATEQDQSTENETMITGKILHSGMSKFNKNAEPDLQVKLKLTPISASFQRQRSGSVNSNHEGSIAHWQAANIQPQPMMDRPQSPADMSRLDNVQRMVAEGVPRADSIHNGFGQWHPSSRPSSRPGTPTQYQPYPIIPPGSTHSAHPSMNIHHQQPMHERRGSESGYWTADEAFEDGPARKRAKTMKVQKATKDTFNIGNQLSSLRTAAMGASSLRIHQPTAMAPGAALQRGMSTEEPVRPPTPIPQSRARKPNKRTQSRQHNMELAEPSSPLQQPVTQNVPPFSNASSPEDVRERSRPRSAINTPMEMPSSPPVMLQHQTSPGLPSPPAGQQNRSKDEIQDSGYFSTHTDLVHFTMGQPKEDDMFANFQMNSTYADMDFSNFVNDSFDLDMNLQSATGTPPPFMDQYTPVFDEESSYEGPTPQPDCVPTENMSVLPDSQHQTIPTPTLMPTIAPSAHQNNQSKKPDTFQRPMLPTQSLSRSTGNTNGRPNAHILPRICAAPPPNHQPTRSMQRTQSVLPPVPASDPGTRGYKRSKTWGDMSDVAMSDSVGTEEGKVRGKKKIGKEQTKARLETAIATGGIPPFCHNCGVIETPAWRRGFTRTFDNAVFPYHEHPTSLEAGEMCYKAPQETTESGEIKTWKGWRVERKPGALDADEWEQINLCNPCGLWFHKTKVPRPPEKWQKKEPKKEKKRKRPPKPPKSRTQPRRSVAGGFDSDMPESDAQEPGSEDSSPADTSAEDGVDDNNDVITIDGDDQNNEQQDLELPPMPKSMTAHVGRRTVLFSAVDTRQVKSSPLARGTSAMPIDVDQTPNKPVRRVLFPSPGSNLDRQVSVPMKERTNEQLLPSFIRRSPRLNKVRDVFAQSTVAVPVITVDGNTTVIEKENLTPRIANTFDDLDDDLFGDMQDSMPPPPMTPTPKRRSERLHSRTPQTMRSTSREFGAAISGNARKQGKSPKTPGQKQDQDLLSELFMDTVKRKLDFEDMTPFTKRMAAAISEAITPASRQSSTRTGFTPRDTPKNRTGSSFDFPNLPSLEGSSPSRLSSARGGLGELFSELPTDRLYSEIETMIGTDAAVPSSPPLHQDTWDESLKNMMELGNFESTDWDWFEHDDENKSKLQTPKKQKGYLSVTTPDRSALRRSPRRAGRE